ncbi:hypothetical protein QF021_001966 [Acidovorax delafieldii]|uniref:hypothetical protein n=1 Tax=Acidovorax delafieldii TaxID=47920 RepID=UPI002864E211|nr:hypothetical protein [Acidovorax delafieldii]MDR6153877.1 hypothetical protein [Acidovorax delafieldii]
MKSSAADARNTLQVAGKPGVSKERQLADLGADGIVSNAMTARAFLNHSQPNLSITELVASVQAHGEKVNGNDLAAAEQMLMAQAIALNSIFAEMARRSALNMGDYLDATDRYMRLALKAQGQCRATLETLAAIKNPPVVFARQANIAHGPQQVNNGVAPGRTQGASAHAHEQTGIKSNELLEMHDGKRLDAGAQGAAGLANPRLAAVGTVNRAKVGRGTRQSSTKQL